MHADSLDVDISGLKLTRIYKVGTPVFNTGVIECVAMFFVEAGQLRRYLVHYSHIRDQVFTDQVVYKMSSYKATSWKKRIGNSKVECRYSMPVPIYIFLSTLCSQG